MYGWICIIIASCCPPLLTQSPDKGKNWAFKKRFYNILPSGSLYFPPDGLLITAQLISPVFTTSSKLQVPNFLLQQMLCVDHPCVCQGTVVLPVRFPLVASQRTETLKLVSFNSRSWTFVLPVVEADTGQEQWQRVTELKGHRCPPVLS